MMVYVTLIFDVCKLIPQCSSPSPRLIARPVNDEGRTDDDDDGRTDDVIARPVNDEDDEDDDDDDDGILSTSLL